MNRSLVETIEDLAAGIIDRNRIHIAAYGVASRIHPRDDGELRIRGEQHHDQHQNSLGNNRAVVSPRQHRDYEKDQSAEKSYPVEADQGAADDHTSGVDTCGRSGKERRKLAEGDGSKNGAKENQRAQPKAKQQVHQGMEKGAHLGYIGARPVSRSIRRAIGGWVEKRLAKLAPPIKGATINKWAVEGEACIGSCLE